ncbi:MAG: hypothetical protein ACRCUT_06160, partial [Spirochaetota bacterium]
RYSGEAVPFDREKAAAIGIIGTYLNSNDAMTASNLLTVLSRILKAELESRPELYEEASSRFLRATAPFSGSNFFADARRNHAILLLNAVAQNRRNEVSRSDGSPASVVPLFSQELALYEKYLSAYSGLKNEGWHNAGIEYLRYLSSLYSPDPQKRIAETAGLIKQLLSGDAVEKSDLYSSCRAMLTRSFAADVNNTGIGYYSSGDAKTAEAIFLTGITSAQKNGIYDPLIFSPVEKNLAIIRRAPQP